MRDRSSLIDTINLRDALSLPALGIMDACQWLRSIYSNCADLVRNVQGNAALEVVTSQSGARAVLPNLLFYGLAIEAEIQPDADKAAQAMHAKMETADDGTTMWDISECADLIVRCAANGSFDWIAFLRITQLLNTSIGDVYLDLLGRLARGKLRMMVEGQGDVYNPIWGEMSDVDNIKEILEATPYDTDFAGVYEACFLRYSNLNDPNREFGSY